MSVSLESRGRLLSIIHSGTGTGTGTGTGRSPESILTPSPGVIVQTIDES